MVLELRGDKLVLWIFCALLIHWAFHIILEQVSAVLQCYKFADHEVFQFLIDIVLLYNASASKAVAGKLSSQG